MVDGETDDGFAVGFFIGKADGEAEGVFVVTKGVANVTEGTTADIVSVAFKILELF